MWVRAWENAQTNAWGRSRTQPPVHRWEIHHLVPLPRNFKETKNCRVLFNRQQLKVNSNDTSILGQSCAQKCPRLHLPQKLAPTALRDTCLKESGYSPLLKSLWPGQPCHSCSAVKARFDICASEQAQLRLLLPRYFSALKEIKDNGNKKMVVLGMPCCLETA